MSLAEKLLAASNYATVGTTEGVWRQSVHSAYYAVFHAIGEAGQDLLFKDPEAGRIARRNVSHESAAKRARHYKSADPTNPSWNSKAWVERSAGRVRVPPSTQLVHLADAIVDLQGQRLTADYDFTVVVGLGDARTACQKARKALETVSGLRQAPDPAFLEMLRWMYFPKTRD